MHCGRSENRGWGRPNIRPCLGGEAGRALVVCAHRASCQLARTRRPSQAGRRPSSAPREGKALTHTKLSLGIQLKAHWAADFILFCKPKGQVVRTPGHCGQGAPGQTAALAVALS